MYPYGNKHNTFSATELAELALVDAEIEQDFARQKAASKHRRVICTQKESLRALQRSTGGDEKHHGQYSMEG